MPPLKTGTSPKTPQAAGGHRRSTGHDDGKLQHLVKVLGCLEEIAISGTRDQRIAQIAALQRGRIAGRQCKAAGITSGALEGRVKAGRLFRTHRGVFAVGHAGAVELGEETAALLAVGEGAVLAGLSAAVLWDMLDPGAADGFVHVLSPRDCRLTHAGIRVHHTRILAAADLRIHRRLPVVSPARALLDVAEQSTVRRTELALDRGIVTRLLTPAGVTEVIRRAPSRHGAKVLKDLMRDSESTTLTRSQAEERVLELIRGAQLPAPRLNVRLHGFEVDFYWPDHGLVLEVDGFRYHSSRQAFERDRRKDATLHAAQIMTMRVTWRQIAGEPLAVIARLAQALVGARLAVPRPGAPDG